MSAIDSEHVVRTHCLIVRASHSWYPSVVDVRARIESVLGSAVFCGCALVKVATNEKRVAARRTKKCRAMTPFCYLKYSGKQGYHFVPRWRRYMILGLFSKRFPTVFVIVECIQTFLSDCLKLDVIPVENHLATQE